MTHLQLFLSALEVSSTLETSVMHHLPVISSEEMMAILEAIHCLTVFTSTGKMWSAKMWGEKLKISLQIFHENLHLIKWNNFLVRKRIARVCP